MAANNGNVVQMNVVIMNETNSEAENHVQTEGILDLPIYQSISILKCLLFGSATSCRRK